MQRLNGKTTAEEIRAELKTAVTGRKQKGMKVPHLAAVLVGNDGGSMSYVGAKVKACDEIGFNSSLIQFDDSVTEEELLIKVEELNNNEEIDEIELIQSNNNNTYNNNNNKKNDVIFFFHSSNSNQDDNNNNILI